jgi:hypothetical protein
MGAATMATTNSVTPSSSAFDLVNEETTLHNGWDHVLQVG